MKKGLEILGISVVDADAKYAGKVDLKNLDMSGKSTDMRLNDTDFKELSFYGVRAVA
jgi:hypothetical protein